MVKQIVRDVFFLGQPSEPATKADIQVGKDLQDTLQANRERCVGMAANIRCLLYTSIFHLLYHLVYLDKSQIYTNQHIKMCIRDRYRQDHAAQDPQRASRCRCRKLLTRSKSTDRIL